LALQPKGYAASLFYTPFDRTSAFHGSISNLKSVEILTRLLRRQAPEVYLVCSNRSLGQETWRATIGGLNHSCRAVIGDRSGLYV